MKTLHLHSEHEQLEPTPLIGRDEMNLAEFPIALLADRTPNGQKTLYFEDQHGRLTVTGSDAYGLPTATDTDVIVALVYLTKIRNDFKDVKVNFSRYELVRILGWCDEGKSYKRLDRSLNRWGGVWLVYDKCWWDNKSRKYVSAKMHILESVVIADSSGGHRSGQGNLPLSTFTWNKTFIESCQADNLRQLNLDTYFSLNSAISKRLYRFLGKRFYVQGDWTFDLHKIAFDRVGLSRSYTDAGKIKEKLQPAIEELEAIGFLRPLSREERYHRIDCGQWTIRLTRQAPTVVPASQVITPAVVVAQSQVMTPAETLEPNLVAELTARQVTKTTAEELVKRHAAEVIQAKIDVFDWLRGKQDKRVNKSPAGYLVESIQRDYAVPAGFVSREERAHRAATAQAAEQKAKESHRQKQDQAAREQVERQAIDAYWTSLSKDQQTALDEAAAAQADPETLKLEHGPLKRLGQTVRRHAYIRDLLLAECKLPAVEA